MKFVFDGVENIGGKGEYAAFFYCADKGPSCKAH